MCPFESLSYNFKTQHIADLRIGYPQRIADLNWRLT